MRNCFRLEIFIVTRLNEEGFNEPDTRQLSPAPSVNSFQQYYTNQQIANVYTNNFLSLSETYQKRTVHGRNTDFER